VSAGHACRAPCRSVKKKRAGCAQINSSTAYPDIFTHHRNLPLWNFLSLDQRKGKRLEKRPVTVTICWYYCLNRIQYNAGYLVHLWVVTLLTIYWARTKTQERTNLFQGAEQSEVLWMCVCVFVCVCVLLSGRPSHSVNDLCVCEAEVTAEVIRLRARKSCLLSPSASRRRHQLKAWQSESHTRHPTVVTWQTHSLLYGKLALPTFSH